MSIIEQIKEKLTISQLCQKLGIEVNRHGFAFSVYKQERTPSMRIRLKTNTYKCFATGQGGDVIELYKASQNCSTSEAVRVLSGLCGISGEKIEMPDRVPAPIIRQDDQTPLEAMTEDERYYYWERTGMEEEEQKVMRDIRLARLWVNNEVFREFYTYCKSRFSLTGLAGRYLTEGRGFSEAIIERFKLFGIGNYNEVNNHMKKMFPIDMLQRAGLFNKREDGSGNLIFFKHRIIIPYLHDGEIIYMRGRYFDEDGNASTDSMKYIGLKDDGLGVNKARRFFNTDVLKSALQFEKMYIVEGEFDAIAVEDMGFNAIAVPGAGSLPEHQLHLLKGFRIVLCMDNDTAGEGLKQKLVEKLEGQGNEVYIKELPTKDANAFMVAHG